MSSGSDQSEFRIEKCKACSSKIRLPANIKPTSKIQCPLCQAKFTLADIDGPPVAIVIEDEPEQAPRIQTDDANVPFVDRVVVENSGQDVWESIGAPKYEKSTSRGRSKSANVVSESKTPESTRQKSRHKSEKRRRERIKGSKKNDFVKMVVGALLALPIAQMLLWWLAGIDPLNLAPQVSKFVPGIVPAKLRPVEEKEGERDTNRNNDPDDPDAPVDMQVRPNDL